jgi:hypothetical protein
MSCSRAVFSTVAAAGVQCSIQQIAYKTVFKCIDTLDPHDCENTLPRSRFLCNRDTGLACQPAQATTVYLPNPSEALRLSLTPQDMPRPPTDTGEHFRQITSELDDQRHQWLTSTCTVLPVLDCI